MRAARLPSDPPLAGGPFRATLDHVADAVVIVAADLEVVYVNPAFVRLSGYDAERVVGAGLDAIDGASAEDGLLARLEGCRSADAGYDGPATLARVDESTVPVACRIVAVRDDDGAVAFWSATLRESRREPSRGAGGPTFAATLAARLDLSHLARATAEEVVRATGSAAGAFLYSTTGGEAEPSGAVVRRDMNAVASLAVPPVDVEALFEGELVLRGGPELARRFPAVDSDDDGAPTLALRVVSPTVGTVGAIVLRRDDGVEFDEDDIRRASDIAAHAGAAVGNALLYDRTRRAEARLGRQVRLASAITTSLGEGVFALDADGRFTFVNPAAERLLGLGFGDLVGSLAGERVRFHVRTGGATVPFDFASVVSDRRAVHVEHCFYVRGDGTTLSLSFTAAPIVSREAGAGVVVVFRDVTEQRRAVAALSESEQRFRSVADTAPVLIWVSDTEGRFGFLNKTWRDFRGRRENDGRWEDVLHPDDAARFALGLARAVARREPFSDEFRIRHASGEHRWVLTTGVPRFAPDGRLAGLIGSCVDITTQKEIHDLVKRTERDWVTTVDAVADLIVLEDEAGRVRRCNKAVSAFFGLEYRSVVGLDIAELFFGDGADAAAAFEASFRGGHVELRLPSRDGWYEVSSFPLATVADAAGGWVHIVKDVTRRRDHETALRRLNAAIGQAAESIAIVDAGGKVRYVNPALEATTGYARDEVIGRDVARLAAGPTDRREFRAIRRTLLDGRVWNGSFAAQTKDGAPYYAEATMSPVRGAAGEVVDYVVLFRDVTERKRYEAIAEAVNMMDNAGYIFSGIRHELGNPINSVKTALTVLKRNLADYSPETVENYVDRTLSEVARVEFLLKALKTFSMHEAPKIEAVEIAPFVENFCTLARDDFADRGIRIEFAAATDAGVALVDSRALHQVLLNLFANAADALDARDTPTIRVSLARERWRVVLRVADNGVGLTRAQAANLFKPFHTSKVHGTGLGLVIIKKLVTKMRGTVMIDGWPGEGTEVTIVLEGAK